MKTFRGFEPLMVEIAQGVERLIAKPTRLRRRRAMP
jgi:hypothetical protein